MNKKTLQLAVVLVALYIGAQIIADIGATRLVEIAGIVMPGGTFIFALTFTLRDMLHKQLGRKATIATIIMGAIVNALLSAYLWGIGKIPAPVFFGLDAEWLGVFAWVPSITLGSILAELLSQWVDTELYELWVRKVTRRFQWSRVLVSNAGGLVIDTLAFSVLAFTVLPLLFGGESLPLLVSVARIGSGQIIFKAVVTMLSLPLVYLIPDGPGLE